MTGFELGCSRERTEGKKGASGNSWGKVGKRDRKGSKFSVGKGNLENETWQNPAEKKISRKCSDKNSDCHCREVNGDRSKQCLFPGGARSMCIQVNGGGLGKWHLLTGTQMHWQPRDPMLDQEQMVSAGLNGID